MELKRFNKLHLILLLLLCGMIPMVVLTLNPIKAEKKNRQPITINSEIKPKSSQDQFEITSDFEASTNFISPESSPGYNDGTFFSFQTNKDGNYTISIRNFPSLLTSSIEMETYTAFDNPSGTDLWYVAYVELDIEIEGQTIIKRVGNFDIKLLTSKDKGNTWNSTTVASFTPSGTNIFEILRDLGGVAIAAHPKEGIIGIVTWYNTSELKFIRSMDNGTTWSTPKTIATAKEVNCESKFNIWKGYYPNIEIGILRNTSMYIISETNPPNYPLVYFESHNNGTDWNGPMNVTVSDGKVQRSSMDIQVDQQTGDYWLMWQNVDGSTNNISWAEFEEDNDETLSSNLPKQTFYSSTQTNFDFYYDKRDNLFRAVTFHRYYSFGEEYFEVLNWSSTGFGNEWKNISMGYHDAFRGKTQNFFGSVNFVYDGDLFRFFYEEYYSGFDEIYQYILYKNPVFWRKEGVFAKNELKQVFWNGRINKTIRINITTVKVFLFVQNSSTILNQTLFITIDNEIPSFDEYSQERQYFNPQSSNITLTQIPWNVLASEECDLHLEIFKMGTSISDWQRISDNNLNDFDPQIFRSITGQLYILYLTNEIGTQTVYLIKSEDNGITWSNPVEVFQYIGENMIRYSGAACQGVVIIYLYDPATKDEILLRSFDEGETFRDQIIITGYFGLNDVVSKIILTRNGTLFLSYYQQNPMGHAVMKSITLGLNWSTPKVFLNHSTNFFSLPYALPDLAYDHENDLVHFVMPFINSSFGGNPDYRVANHTFSTFNMSKNEWGAVKSVSAPFKIGFFPRDPKLIINRDDPKSPLKIRAIYMHEMDVSGGFTNYTFKEIVSTNLGESWSGPYLLQCNNVTTFTSSLFDIFYVTSKSDGHDYEVYFSREGSLVLSTEESMSPTISTEVTFNGIDDFGNYIDEGNYTYKMRLRDDAGNEIGTDGWFYADYNAPQITDMDLSRDYPLPRYDLTVTVNVTDSINFTVYLKYKKDSGSWQTIRMKNISVDYFSAEIPGDATINNVEYYISAVDLAGNEYILDNGGNYYSYGMPNFIWSSEGLFKEDKDYSSSNSYTFTITISSDLEYVQDVIFRYSYDEGDSWDDLELEQSSPEFEGELDDIPGDLRELYYKVIIIDIYGNEYELRDTQKIDFYPEVPSPEIDVFWTNILIIISAVIGFLVAFGYIRLKNLSHEKIYQKILRREFIKKPKEPKEELEAEAEIIPLESTKIATPFTMTYLAVLCGTVLLFSLGILVAYITPAMGILILAGSLLLGVYGYMILMSRDITINVYLERIYTKNIILESFQMAFMFFNIVMILLVGYSMDWFRYYLVESTFNFGDVSIPRLYLSVIGVFFTSLVLVIITTYVQLRKIVVNILKQKSQGASENMLLYLKDQNSSRMITHTGYKTIVFLVTVLLAIVTTTNLLTNETGVLLIIILIPFAIAGLLALIVHRLVERKKIKKEKEHMEMLFVDSKKICTKCGESAYLSNKFCGSCGAQLIFEDMMGTYVSRCTKCNGLIDENAKHCTECGKKVQQKSTIK